MCDGGAGVLQTIVNDTRQLGELEAAWILYRKMCCTQFETSTNLTMTNEYEKKMRWDRRCRMSSKNAFWKCCGTSPDSVQKMWECKHSCKHSIHLKVSPDSQIEIGKHVIPWKFHDLVAWPSHLEPSYLQGLFAFACLRFGLVKGRGLFPLSFQAWPEKGSADFHVRHTMAVDRTAPQHQAWLQVDDCWAKYDLWDLRVKYAFLTIKAEPMSMNKKTLKNLMRCGFKSMLWNTKNKP